MHSKLYDVLHGKEANFMLPFYWLHGNHYDTIPQEVERIYNSGCRAFCVESRPHNDFVGPGWWRDMDRILQEAQKRDMQVWILDDDHFPTGNAAGHIKNFHPGKRRWDIGERHIDVAGPLKDALLMTNETEGKRVYFAGDMTSKEPGSDFPTEVLEQPLELAICEAAHFDATAYVPLFAGNPNLKKLCFNHYSDKFLESVMTATRLLAPLPVVRAIDNMEFQL